MRAVMIAVVGVTVIQFRRRPAMPPTLMAEAAAECQSAIWQLVPGKGTKALPSYASLRQPALDHHSKRP